MAGPAICGCCGGIAVSSPSASFARFGLDQATLRSGGYCSYRDSLIARLSSAEHGPLADLKSRDPAVDFSIALIDVDHFKSWNDLHGHQIGDMVLQTVAQLISSTSREIDACGRYGGARSRRCCSSSAARSTA